MTDTYVKEPVRSVSVGDKTVNIFEVSDQNIDQKTVNSFGEEWKKFSSFDEEELTKIGNDYFDILPAALKKSTTRVLDVGCGTGRWAAYLAPQVGFIECIDPSDAVFVAARLLSDIENTRIAKVDVENIPFEDQSFDLVYSLGVLHHIPDTAKAMKKCINKVKPGGYFLVYLYYNLENRGMLFKTIFKLSNIFRKTISSLPGAPKRVVCDLLAIMVYWPLARTSNILSSIGLQGVSKKIPLSYYGNKSFWIMKNDALDRFGTPLEQRFSKNQIQRMMEQGGLINIIFSNEEPYWHAIGQKPF